MQRSQTIGLEVIRRAKAAKPELDIVVLTVVDDESIARMAKELGASAYITKPVAVEDLERVVLSRLNP